MSSPPVNKRVDPGWNDPPTLNYSVSNPPPKSRIANKRVAFPLSSPVRNTIPTASIQSKSDHNGLNNFDSEEALKKILQNVEISIKNVNVPSGVIQSKIDIFTVMWKENKLNNKMQKLVLDMSKHTAEGDSERANKIHLQLMMENAVLCEPWISGFRQLVPSEVLKK